MRPPVGGRYFPENSGPRVYWANVPSPPSLSPRRTPMGRNKDYMLAVVVLMLAPTMASAQGDMEKSRTVAGGGITAAGWMGKVDAKDASRAVAHEIADLIRQKAKDGKMCVWYCRLDERSR